ncbi:alpha beta hydrolase fold family [Hirsutella rhossiliensis]|uniref:Alpha beta hydrolase fold family n=1 Tax=Hirsutella rhossiliensis TaxID=111463 RepID=A0A9P8N5A1_9HYPO|nr:alpha beta hydrolase fold family [Hirsutella rhossiliensis]KAH0964902.1 alpha beta hydrolase fold family [Hirsutella rhossiliensis]
MIGTSLGEWILIRLTILLFRYTPLLYVALLAALCLGHGVIPWNSTAARTLCALLASEALFYAFVWIPYTRRLRQPASHPAPLSPSARSDLFRRCMANVANPESYLRGWFLGADIDDIGHQNVREFLLWAFFDMSEADALISPHREAISAELDDYVAIAEARLGRPLGPGRGSAQSLRLTLDRIDTAYRSLAWYVVILAVDHASHVAMSWHGFRYYARAPAAAANTFPPRPLELLARRRSPAPGLGYWYHPHQSGQDDLPVLFFHGIGIGLWTYVRFLTDLRAASKPGANGRGRGVIAVEILSVSFRLTPPVLGKADFLQEMASILDHHSGWDKFTMVSHSYGSVPSTHVLLSPTLGPRVPSVVLVDPVTVMLHMPGVAYNFTRRRPRQANEWQLWYFASTDPGVAHCLGRHFFWRENIIWKEDLLSCGGKDSVARKAVVFLAGRDLIVDAAAVAQYLGEEQATSSENGRVGAVHHKNSHGRTGKVDVIVSPNLDHAQIFDRRLDHRRLIEIVGRHCRG